MTKRTTPKFDYLELLRYAAGETALFWVTEIRPNHGGKGKHRYYGQHVLGGVVGWYEQDVKKATLAEIRRWKNTKPLT